MGVDVANMLYIIGTDHGTQYIYCSDHLNQLWRVEEFAAYVRREALRLHVELLTEELSEEAVTKNMNCAVASNAGRVAGDLGIAHRFCDPDSDQRRTLGIPSEREIGEQLGFGRALDDSALKLVEEEKRKYWAIREEFWFNCISGRLRNGVLFICGNDHVRRFERLVVQHGYPAEVLIENWYADPRQITPR